MSLFHVSEPVVNSLHSVFSWVAIISTVVAAVSATGAFLTERAKSTYAEAERRDTQARIDAANLRAENAELVAEGIRSQIKDRDLAPDKVLRLAERMASFAKLPKTGAKLRVAVFPTNQSVESHRLADQIAQALGPNGAGCSINRNRVDYGHRVVVSGVAILTSENTHCRKVADQLCSELQAVGIVAEILPFRRPSTEENEEFDSSLSIMVGDKP